MRSLLIRVFVALLILSSAQVFSPIAPTPVCIPDPGKGCNTPLGQ